MSGRKYSDAFRQQVLETYERVGLRAAERETGVDRSTIREWARQAGVDGAEITARISEQNRLAAAASYAKLERERYEHREKIYDRVLKIASAAEIRELEILAAGGFSQEDLQAVTNARMKAIQQAELLGGRPTSRMDLGQEQLLDGVLVAMQRVLAAVAERAGDAFAEEMRNLLALELREAKDKVSAMIEAEIVEEAEVAAIESADEEQA